MINLTALEICRVPIDQIDDSFKLTDFSLTSQDGFLERSIREMGVTHPLLIVPIQENYGVISGHQRYRLAKILKIPDLPARIANTADKPSMLEANLAENISHKQYSEVEKGLILHKFYTQAIDEKHILNKVMPLLGLEKNKRVFEDLLRTANLPPELRRLMHELNLPLRTISACFRIDEESLLHLEKLLTLLRPGMNKLRDLLGILEETSRLEQVTIAKLLSRPAITTILEYENLSCHEKYDRIFQEVYQWRYPTLAGLKKRVLLSLDKLKLSDPIKLRTAENFEHGELKIEFKFTSQEELKKYADELAQASQSAAMAELIDAFKGTQ